MEQSVRLSVLKREGNHELVMLGYITMPVGLYKILEQQGYVKIASQPPVPDYTHTATQANLMSIGLEFLKTPRGEWALLADGNITDHHNFQSIRSLVYVD